MCCVGRYVGASMSFFHQETNNRNHWLNLLTPKVKPFFRLNFVEDILAIGRMLKLLFVFL